MAKLPTRTEIRRARKAELQKWCRNWDLEDTGTVADLRERLLKHLEALEEEEAEQEEAEEEVEEEAEEEVYEVRMKPTLEPVEADLLALRSEVRTRRPSFHRQEWFRYQKLGKKWRRPRGLHSKMRRGFRYRGRKPTTGYAGPVAVRGLHSSGFREVMVHRPSDLDGMDPKTQAARIAHSVGTRKRLAIQERADELEIRVLNRVVE